MKNLFGSPTLVKSCWNLSFIVFERAVAFATPTISQTHLATYLAKVIGVMASPTVIQKLNKINGLSRKVTTLPIATKKLAERFASTTLKSPEMALVDVAVGTVAPGIVDRRLWRGRRGSVMLRDCGGRNIVGINELWLLYAI
jgi:hypothetical protein